MQAGVNASNLDPVKLRGLLIIESKALEKQEEEATKALYALQEEEAQLKEILAQVLACLLSYARFRAASDDPRRRAGPLRREARASPPPAAARGAAARRREEGPEARRRGARQRRQRARGAPRRRGRSFGGSLPGLPGLQDAGCGRPHAANCDAATGRPINRGRICRRRGYGGAHACACQRHSWWAGRRTSPGRGAVRPRSAGVAACFFSGPSASLCVYWLTLRADAEGAQEKRHCPAFGRFHSVR